MGWERKVRGPVQHVCAIPMDPAIGVGSRWRCDKCHTLYEVKRPWLLPPPVWRAIEGAAWWNKPAEPPPPSEEG